jgi:hypothetical protein
VNTVWRLFATAVLTTILHAEAPAIRMENDFFVVSGLGGDHPKPQDVFAVYAGTGDVPPVMGAYSMQAGALVFRPKYPLAQGVTYRAVLHVGNGPAIEKAFTAPVPAAHPATSVTHVYPSGDTVPENILKLYVEFSGPMSRGLAWPHIKLLEADGSQVDLPFLEVDQELWDPGFRRMTVLFDPGRIKRGLVPNRDAGSPIEAGKQYTLVIDRGWQDAEGNPLAGEVRRTFRVGPAERAGIDLKQWRIETGKTLSVTFPKPLDYALLSHAIRVVGPDGKFVEGAEQIDRNETRWSFTPAASWKAGDYKLEIDMALEDVAGNRIGRAFDVDVFDQGAERITRKTAELPFRISGK